MAMPVGAEDLKKLKKFIDFVANNPTILNLPQLDFIKQFIEKFGGKVPSGEFKMPAGGGCPFGGEAAGEEKKPENEPVIESESDEGDDEMESDSESTPELDMEVTSAAAVKERYPSYIELDSSNAVYLKDSTEYSRKSKRKKSKSFSLPDENSMPKSFKKEGASSEDEAFDMDMDYRSCNDIDPIGTSAEVVIKADSDVEEGLVSADDVFNEDSWECITEDSDFEEEEIKRRINTQRKKASRRFTGSSKPLKHTDDEEFWRSVSGYKNRKKQPKPVNCTDKCKHKCHLQLISETQRRNVCAEYWALSVEDRKNYLLGFVESRHISKIRARRSDRPSRGFTNAYFLPNEKGERVRVCLNYFQRTFCISNNIIKIATQNRNVNEITKTKKDRKPLINTTNNPRVEEFENVGGAETPPNVNVDSNRNTEQLESQNNNTQQQISQVSTDDNTPLAETKSTTSKSKKLKKDRKPQPVKCDEGCTMKCMQYFTEEQRTQICQHFWTMDYKRQKDFVLSKIESRDVESLTAKEYRTSQRAQRTFSNRYYFRGPRGNNVRVCAKFFMATLCIGRHVISNALRFADRQTGSYAGEDRRGRHTPGNKIPDELVQDMKRYIESYPTWVPHKNYKTRFLHSSLSIQQMWRDYKQIRESEGRKYCSASFFRHIFHKDFRLAFLKPSSRHAQKVNAMKRNNVFSSGSLPKKMNMNISEFTGEEGGGFWIKPSGTEKRLMYESEQMTSQTQAKDAVCDSVRKPTVMLPLRGTERNALAQSNQHANAYYGGMSFSQPIPHSQQTSAIATSNMYHTRLDQEEQPAVLRML